MTVTEVWATSKSLKSRSVTGIIANIEAGILEPLHESSEALVSGGWLILSGILDHEWVKSGERRVKWISFYYFSKDGEWRRTLGCMT